MATISSRPPRPSSKRSSSRGRERLPPSRPVSPPQMPPGIPFDTFGNDVLVTPPPPVIRRKRSNSLQARKKKNLAASFSHISSNNDNKNNGGSSSNSIRSLPPFRKKSGSLKNMSTKNNENDNGNIDQNVVPARSSWDSDNKTNDDDDELLINSKGNNSSIAGWESAPIEADEMIGMVIPPPPSSSSSSSSRQVNTNTTSGNDVAAAVPNIESNNNDGRYAIHASSSGSTATTPVSEYAGEEAAGSVNTNQSSSSTGRGRRNNKSSKFFSRSSTFSSNSNASIRSRSPFMERMFGDSIPSSQRIFPRSSDLPTSLPPIHNRTALPTNVFHNPATNFWIATVNLQQSGRQTSAKHLRAFSYPSELEAEQGSQAYAPPRMLPFQSNPNCFLCHGKFALFRRAKHCRNCGICVCSSCSITWPSKMIPDTFNIKHEKLVSVCKSCNWLSNAFRDALLQGNEGQGKALYSTGNINLRSPFANSTTKHTEQMFPIHCATQGGNLPLITWLIEEKCCPIRLLRTGNKQNLRQLENPVCTSLGRSVLQIAMTYSHVHLIQYFIVNQQISIFEMKELKTVLTAFDAVIRKLPADYAATANTASGNTTMDNNAIFTTTAASMVAASAPFQQQGTGEATTQHQYNYNNQVTPPPRELLDVDRIFALKHNKKRFINGIKHSLSPTTITNKPSVPNNNNNDNTHNPYQNNNNESYDDDDSDTMTVTSVADACILCYEKSIDCVITPCGHQICCMECSTCLQNCPVCQAQGTFIRIYKP